MSAHGENEQQASCLWKALLPLCVWAFLDSVDMSYFGGVLRALEVDLGLSMADLGLMQGAMCAAVMLAVPVWGVVIDQGVLSCKKLLVFSSMAWALITIAIGACATTFNELLVLRFLNTAVLCSSLPVMQSVITGLAAPEMRGACFSACGFAAAFGVMAGSWFSTWISEAVVLTLPGWRSGLILIGVASLLFSGAVMVLMKEPSHVVVTAEKHGGAGRLALVALSNLKDHLRTPSFLLIVLQCAVYQMSCQSLVYVAMWLQYCGLSDAQAGTVVAIWKSGSMFGSILGGFTGDALYRVDEFRGRTYLGQVCAAAVVPLALVLFSWTPRGPEYFWHYASLMFVFGVFDVAWGPGLNKPVMSQVAGKRQIASLMSWKLTFEYAFGTFVGPVFITGFMTMAGYHSSKLKVSKMTPELRNHNAVALGQLITTLTVFSYVCTFFLYSGLHYTYERDVKHAMQQEDLDETIGKKQHEKTALLTPASAKYV